MTGGAVIRKIEVLNTEKMVLTDEVETLYERRITAFGNSAKLDAPKKYIGRRAYVIILKD